MRGIAMEHILPALTNDDIRAALGMVLLPPGARRTWRRGDPGMDFLVQIALYGVGFRMKGQHRMKERDYIVATNLAKARIAKSVTVDIMVPNGERDAWAEIQRTLQRWIDRWENQC